MKFVCSYTSIWKGRDGRSGWKIGRNFGQLREILSRRKNERSRWGGEGGGLRTRSRFFRGREEWKPGPRTLHALLKRDYALSSGAAQ